MSEISQIGRLCANEHCNFLVTFEESGGFCCKRCYANHVRPGFRFLCCDGSLAVIVGRRMFPYRILLSTVRRLLCSLSVYVYIYIYIYVYLCVCVS